MAGNKPEVKVAIKSVDGGNRVDLFAFWRRDNGKLSGSMDRKVRGIRVYLEDGTHQDLKRIDGNKHSHWIDCYEERPPAPDMERGAPSGGSDDFPPDDFGDDGDSIPF
jgi:hypothetical protein